MTILERDKENFEDSIRTEAISIRFVIGGTIARLVLFPKNDFQNKLSNIFQKIDEKTQVLNIFLSNLQ